MRPPSIQWYYKQYLGDNKVLAMDWDARGMHVHLLMLSIQEEPPGTIPADDAAIRRWLSLPLGSVDSDQTWRRVKPQLLAAWQPEGDRLANHGMQEACERRDNYRNRGGGRKPVRDLNEKICKSHVDKNALAVDVDFKKEMDAEEIYGIYPRKIAKRAALKAITSAIFRLKNGNEGPPGIRQSFDDVKKYLIQRTKLFAGSPAGQAGEYTPHPATWYNDSRYLDDEREWTKYGSGNEPSKTQQRVANNRAAIIEGLFGPNARPGSQDDGLRVDVGRVDDLGKRALKAVP